MRSTRGKITRRGVAGGVLALIALAGGGAALKFDPIFAKRYPPTPYDDLLAQIVDREPAAKLGAALHKSRPDLTPGKIAAKLRQPGGTFASRAASDAPHNRLVEVEGWVLPESVALYAALAATA